MSNEELAALIQSGERDKLVELWEQVRRFVHNQAYKWAAALNGRGGVTIEDFQQTAFLALLEALNGWNGAKGSFLTWYGFRLREAFTEAAGQRTQRDRKDPLQNCMSLDAPLADGEGEPLHLEDILPDAAAEMEINAVAERDFCRSRRMAVCQAIGKLREDQRNVVILRYYHGLTLDQTAARLDMGRASVQAAEKKALRFLRHPVNSGELRQYR